MSEEPLNIAGSMDREAYEMYHRARQLIESHGGVVIAKEEHDALRAETERLTNELTQARAALLQDRERDEKYKYSPSDFSTMEQWCVIVNSLASEYRKIVGQRNYWRDEYRRVTERTGTEA